MKPLALILAFITLALSIGVPQTAPPAGQPTVIRGLHGFATGLVFSPDGRQLVSAGQDGRIRLWDRVALCSTTLLYRRYTALGALAFSPDGELLAAGAPGLLSALEGPNWRESAFQTREALDVTCLAFNPDGRFLAAGGESGRVSIFNSATRAEMRRIAESDSAVIGIGFLPGGSQLVYGSEDGAASVIEWRNGRRLRNWRHQGGASCLTVSRTGATVITGGLDGTARVWQTSSGACLGVLAAHREPIQAAGFSPDNRWLALGSGDGTATIWRTAGWQRERTLTGLDAVTALAWSPDSRTLATAGWDKTIRIWNVDDRTAARGELETDCVGQAAW